MVVVAPQHVVGVNDTRPEILWEPHHRLALVGTRLMSGKDDVVAELVEDEDGRQFWKPFIGEKLYPELVIAGMGQHADAKV